MIWVEDPAIAAEPSDGFVFRAVHPHLLTFVRTRFGFKVFNTMAACHRASYPASIITGIEFFPVYISSAKFVAFRVAAESEIINREQIEIVHDGN